ncbi:MAG: class I SAM-dependent methyltransferase, partial [Methylotenera sp.]|nr:class I SAM-dependent methyltransferase [Flavobacterium sp.]
DFSKDLMTANKQQYNAANFIEINTPNLLPFQDNMFDLVFSTFVLEHSTNPSLLLKECTRILKPSGKLIILCPDFLNRGKLTSQRAGFSEGTSFHKLKQGKYLDACITLWDNRIKIPFYCFFSKIQAKKNPRFLINLNPVLFEDSFIPDVDAVYATYKDEIVCELSTQFSLEQNSPEINEYEKQHHLIFLSFTLK